MKNFKLIPHQECSQYSIEASIELSNEHLIATYRIQGDLSDINFQATSKNPQRKWDLWEETCCELFIKYIDQPWYIEFNFSPAGDWNCFYLPKFRDNTGEYNSVQDVVVESAKMSDSYILQAKIDLSEIELFNRDDFFQSKIHVGVTAITEDYQKNKQYWALVNEGPVPDFHDVNTFLVLG